MLKIVSVIHLRFALFCIKFTLIGTTKSWHLNQERDTQSVGILYAKQCNDVKCETITIFFFFLLNNFVTFNRHKPLIIPWEFHSIPKFAANSLYCFSFQFHSSIISQSYFENRTKSTKLRWTKLNWTKLSWTKQHQLKLKSVVLTLE